MKECVLAGHKLNNTRRLRLKEILVRGIDPMPKMGTLNRVVTGYSVVLVAMCISAKTSWVNNDRAMAAAWPSKNNLFIHVEIPEGGRSW